MSTHTVPTTGVDCPHVTEPLTQCAKLITADGTERMLCDTCLHDVRVFFDAYVTCALWLSTNDDDEPLEDLYRSDDIAAATFEQMWQDCLDFFCTHYTDLVAHGSMEQCGHDFWLTRCGHGCGFWDRGTGDVGQRLTKAAEVYGEYDLYVGDDGHIYGS